MTAPTLKTERLTLRAVRESDAPRLAALANDFDVVKMTSSMPFPYTIADAEAWVAKQPVKDPYMERTWAVDFADEGFAGVVAFHATGGFGPELGYWFGRPYWGRGVATEAVQRAMAWALGAWEKSVIIAGHFADNDASGGVLVKAGFLYTGEVLMHPCLARGGPAPSRQMVQLA
jgi:RimJ/RimL family protein N-acetyltransferase